MFRPQSCLNGKWSDKRLIGRQILVLSNDQLERTMHPDLRATRRDKWVQKHRERRSPPRNTPSSATSTLSYPVREDSASIINIHTQMMTSVNAATRKLSATQRLEGSPISNMTASVEEEE
ncbi:hypothetical protein N7534_003755 [Penicillium rubens]|nr:hypothetical protein N7534_003755 [Penicillium rubens]